MKTNKPEGGAKQSGAIAYSVPAVATKDEIRSTRKLLLLSQEDFAALFGVTEYTVWRWENGRRGMNEEQTRMLRKIGDERLFADLSDPAGDAGETEGGSDC